MTANKTGRNEPGPCKSGTKYKFCCGDDGARSTESKRNTDGTPNSGSRVLIVPAAPKAYSAVAAFTSLCRVIAEAAKTGTIYIFLNFPILDMNRNVILWTPEGSPEDIERMNAFWGDEAWRGVAYSRTGTCLVG